MKFSEMTYQRPALDEMKKKSESLTHALRLADSPDQALELFQTYQKLIFDFYTMSSMSMIHHTLDTTDEFYKQESDYMDEIHPIFDMMKVDFYRALYESKYRKELEKELGSTLFKNTGLLLKTLSPEIIEDLQEENRLISEYIRLRSRARVSFEDKDYTFSQFDAFKEDCNRDRRHAAWEADGKASEAIGHELDRIFSDMVKVRTKIARKLGFENYIGLGYCRMHRNCYTQSDVQSFRENVLRHIVPVCTRLKEDQKKRLGVDRLNMADAFIIFKDGNPKPKGTPEEIFEAARQMYHEFSPLTGTFFEFLLDNELLDVLCKENKAGGGYCDYLWNYKAPFIFANFNGTQGDVDVLTHEAGHALCNYLSADKTVSDWIEPSNETAEVHSMSMEYFTRPWMESFFGQDADKFLYAQLEDALNSLCYMCIVDEFQHLLYEHPDMTPEQRHAAYKQLESTYRPWLDLDDITFYKDGKRWQRQLHIYEVPFYYIDYALAMTVALQFWAADLSDHDDAWRRYIDFVSAAGTATFLDLVDKAGMRSPFLPETLSHIAGTVSDWLEKHPIH